jgi:phosphonopyruvate decarboxylase
MIDPKKLLSYFKKNKINFFTGVPDSVLKNFISVVNYHKKKITHIVTANEGNAVALASGYYLSTKNLALVYMQNSGLSNAINHLISINHKNIYSIPLILLIGWRGSPGMNDEVQHIVKGKITKRLLNLLNIKYLLIENNNDLKKIKKIINYAKTYKTPVAILIKNKKIISFDKKIFFLKDKSTYLERSFIIEHLLKIVKKNTRIISATGYTSRELFQIRKNLRYKNGKDFYMVGGMGHASMLSLGVSLASSQDVICLDGDGSLLMHLGSLITTGIKGRKNFKYILLNNGSHESVGGQSIDTDKLNFKEISKSFFYKNYFFSNDKKSFLKNIKIFMKKSGPSFFEIKLKSGTLDYLGRPKELIQVKENFMSKI